MKTDSVELIIKKTKEETMIEVQVLTEFLFQVLPDAVHNKKIFAYTETGASTKLKSLASLKA